MAVAIKFRRRRLLQYAAWIIVLGMGLSTLMLHHRGLNWTKRLSALSGDVNAGEGTTFAMPQPTRAVPMHLAADKALEKITTSESTNTRTTSTFEESASKLPTTISTTTTTSTALIRVKCFSHNSDRWIRETKDSNNDAGMTADLIDTLLEGPKYFKKLSAVFQETICHDQSPLKQIAQQSPSVPLEQRVEEWYQRFFYLALHWKFHQPAQNEYQTRKQCQNDENLLPQLQHFQNRHSIRNFDFECRDAKFVVSPIGHIGFGAFINTQVCLTILIALRTGRIPIFTIQSIYPWQKDKLDPWLLAPTNCDRKDLQCYYMPMTPCALLLDDIRNATRYGSTSAEQRWLRTRMDIPEEMKRHRVVAVNSGLQSKGQETSEVRSIVADIVQQLMDEWIKQQKEASEKEELWSKEDWEAMKLAKLWIIEKAREDTTGLLRQFYVYFLRLNPQYKAVLSERMSELIPQDLQPSNTVGVAIRGSDKCKKESTCLPFPRYMELMSDVVHPALDNPSLRPRLIMTTEDPAIFNESLPYKLNASFPFEFLVNDQDNMQGSGFPKDFRDQGENTIVSTMTALLLHLSAGRVYLNCCSNFHSVIRNLITAQCGAQRHGNSFIYSHLSNATLTEKSDWGATPLHTVAHCLNEEGVVPRRFRICCGWYKKDAICDEIWEEHLQNREDFMQKIEKKKIG
ncbi:hypothetical protein IV203_026488 [Nitzschia inconspicua]|uniref:Fucosyltransferase n=1 Tax=Nitzschia inconspicua TaxID=303405 RepID=A0A9K3LJD0_9STRA|nr:hypothetical protein IV203_026488 [Nitzschia inconspicua]